MLVTQLHLVPRLSGSEVYIHSSHTPQFMFRLRDSVRQYLTLGLHTSSHEFCLLGYIAVYPDESLSTFRRNMPFLSLEFKIKLSMILS
jgi:hypothetical protein